MEFFETKFQRSFCFTHVWSNSGQSQSLLPLGSHSPFKYCNYTLCIVLLLILSIAPLHRELLERRDWCLVHLSPRHVPDNGRHSIPGCFNVNKQQEGENWVTESILNEIQVLCISHGFCPYYAFNLEKESCLLSVQQKYKGIYNKCHKVNLDNS